MIEEPSVLEQVYETIDYTPYLIDAIDSIRFTNYLLVFLFGVILAIAVIVIIERAD